MFQRKLDIQNFVPSLPPQPQTGTVLPPTGRDDWGKEMPERREFTRQPIVDATIVNEETIISADLTIIGNVLSKGRVKLEGNIEGDMHCRSLIVGQQGSVTGGIVAEEVSVYGKVAGTVRGDRVNLYSTAHVEGDIYHHGIGIEMGTHYDGRLKWTENPTQGHDAETAVNQVQYGSLPPAT